MASPMRPWHRLPSRQLAVGADLLLRIPVGHSLAVSCVQATQLLNTAASRWRMSPGAAGGFGRHAVHTMLYTSFLKGEERVTATLAGPDGAELTVESGKRGESRGYSHPSQGEGWRDQWDGSMRVLRYLTNQPRPHSTVTQFSGGIDRAWSGFVRAGEATSAETLVQLDTDGGQIAWAGGLAVRAVAAQGGRTPVEGDSGELLERLRPIWAEAGLRAAMGGAESTEARLMRAVRLLVAEPLGLELRPEQAECCRQDYYCPCGLRDHASLLLGSLGEQELRRLAEEPQTKQSGGVSLECHMCNARHLVPLEVLESRL